MTEARRMDAERMEMPPVPDTERTDVDARDDLRDDDLTGDTRESTMDLGPDTMPADRADDRPGDVNTDTADRTVMPAPTSQPTATTGTGTAIPMPSGQHQNTATTAPVATAQGGTHRHDDDWRAVQAGFVDDPAGAVRDADALVGGLIDEIIREREALSERDTDSGEQTERRRLVLREYRKLYQRLVPADH
ncbi:MAG TPA: hypothetical protein VHV74_04185 [Pseudonocardiaceae bacterium]|jgi:hypothetical protein|nr:hypothetical protein [Pseudonocardiaceae bacterium]